MQSFTPSRRGVLGAATWSVPALTLASAAPAFATSLRAGCQPMTYQLTWGQRGAWTYQASSSSPGNGTGTILATPASQPAPGQVMDALPVVFTNTFHGRMVRRGDLTTEGNMVVTSAQVGGTGSRGLEMWQGLSNTSARSASAVYQDRQVITFDFGRPVTNLSFTITDVDAYETSAWRGQYRDAVHVSVPPTRAVLGNRVAGAGTQASPWTSATAPSSSTGLDNATSSRGNVALTYAGPIRSLAVTFWNTETRALSNNASQAIYFSSFAFTANSCLNP